MNYILIHTRPTDGNVETFGGPWSSTDEAMEYLDSMFSDFADAGFDPNCWAVAPMYVGIAPKCVAALFESNSLEPPRPLPEGMGWCMDCGSLEPVDRNHMCWDYDVPSNEVPLGNHRSEHTMGNGHTWRNAGTCPSYCPCRHLDARGETPPRDDCPYVAYWRGRDAWEAAQVAPLPCDADCTCRGVMA